MCIFIFFDKIKQQSRDSDDTHHLSLSTKFPDQINSLTFQVSANPAIAGV